MLSLKECVHHGFCLLSTPNSNYVQEQIVMNFLLDVLPGTVKTNRPVDWRLPRCFLYRLH